MKIKEQYDNILPSYNNVKKAKLIDVKPYQDNDRWYIRLIFEYEMNNGDQFKLEIPKMELPLDQLYLPDIISRYNSLNRDTYIHMRYIDIDGRPCISLQKGKINEIADLSKNGDSYYYAIKQISKQMTIEEIEKELGYKIKIVSNED